MRWVGSIVQPSVSQRMSGPKITRRRRTQSLGRCRCSRPGRSLPVRWPIVRLRASLTPSFGVPGRRQSPIGYVFDEGAVGRGHSTASRSRRSSARSSLIACFDAATPRSSGCRRPDESKSSAASQGIGPPGSSPSRRSTQRVGDDPSLGNDPSRWIVDELGAGVLAACSITATLPISSGRTTWFSSSRKTGHLGHLDQLVDLRQVERLCFGVKRLFEVSRMRWASSQIEHVELVGIGIAELVEVAEELGGAPANLLPKRRGEGATARRVTDVPAPLGEVAEHAGRDHALAAPRPPVTITTVFVFDVCGCARPPCGSPRTRRAGRRPG